MYQRLPAPPLKPTNHLFSSPCSKPQPEIDVFLNFRGEDTRNTFTNHLYFALKDKRIKTFKDDTNLELGHPISPNLLDAIEKSRIAVVILSKNYGSSRCCLEELVKILECKEEGGLTVLPIFFHVDPDHVQNQRETFAVAFAEHENRFQKEQVQIWRNALSEVAELTGKTLTDRPEGEFIQEIVDWIFTKLKDKHSIVYEGGFVGIASRVEEMNSVLDMNSNDVCFIGICGKSGMGKTTLARFVFDKICNQFEACSFLENVKEVSKASGLETLQEQLICDISKGALSVRDVNRRIQVIRNILRDKKVLIVVDDASKKRHLEALARKSWFGPGSRIIVTTDDECLLKSYKFQTVWANGLNNDEAQRLFSQKVHCEIDFLDLVNDLVTYAQGSPLVLKVLGSHLCKRTKEEWESARNQLKAIPNENILEKLEIAYHGLEELEKKLFLHIACFFKGEDQNRVTAILESVGYGDDNIRKLIDKSLITIVGGKLCMHHLIQQMGWKIARGEPVDLGRRSRLWDCTDVLYVLKNNIGTERIEGMVLNLPPDEEQEELKAESFSNMNKLKLLKICKVHLPCLQNLSNELLLLEWHEYPLKSLPESFQPLELVELIMHRSNIKQLPSEFSNLLKLKLIDLSDSQNLCWTPNFNGLPNIERLIFQGCTRLHALHPSVGSLKQLILLNLKDCKCLENLPHEINLESLKILILSGCSKLKKFPKIGRNMTSMLELYLDRTAIEELPSSIKHLTSLTLLNLQDCENLSSFPSVVCSLISLEILILSGCKGQPQKARYLSGLIPTLSSIGTALTLPYTYLTDRQPEKETISLMLPESFSQLCSLESLDLSGCNLLDGALPDDLSYLSSLTSLNLRNNNFTCLPYSISQLSNLKLLFLDHCSKLQSLPCLPLSTQFVSAQGCTSLENYSNQVVVWTSDAARFTFINCHGLADDEEGKIADVPLLNAHFQSLWQRYMEDQIHQLKGFCLVVPQTEISEWFENKECGSSVRIPLPPNLFNDRSWKGIALCVIFVVPPSLKDVSPGQDSKYFHEFICHFDMNGVSLNCPLVLKVPRETFVGSFGLWLYISHARFTEHSDEGSCIGSVIRPTRPDIQIKMCGARILCEQDMIEFVQNSRKENFRSYNEERQLGMLQVCNREEDHPCPFLPERRPNPMRMNLRNNETIQEESTSRETFSNQVIAAGTSKNLSPGSINLGISFGNGQCGSKMSGSRESWFKPCLQNHHKCSSAFNRCSPQSEIPKWFAEQITRSSMTISLPLNLYNKPDWIGFAISAVFSSHKNPTTARMKQGSGFSHMVICHLKTNLGCMNPLLYYGIREEHVLTLLHQREFLWESIIPHRLLSPEWSECTWVEFSFVSDSSDVSALKCAVNLVYRDNLENFKLTMAPCITSYNNFFTSNERLPFYLRDNSNDSDGLYEDQTNGTSGQYSYGGQHPCYQLYQTAVSDFFPSTPYNCCFPPSKIQDWFSHQNHGCSAMMDLPSSLYHNSNWKGLVLYASFSIQGDSNFILGNLNSGKSHSLYCQCQMSMANVNDQTIAFSTSKEEIMWLLELGEFIWISYVPGEPFKNMLQHCSRIEASFVSDWPGVIVQKCALQLLYQHDQVQFEQELKHCNNLILENRELVRKQQEDQKKRNEQYHADEGLQRKIFSNFDFEVKLFPRVIDQSETDETETELGQSDLLENQEKVDKWRVTTKEVTKISGEHFEKSCTESEFDSTQRVIEEISSTKSNHMRLFVAKHPVGIDVRVETIELLLDMESNDVCIVGIYGLGGIGKTTISKAVYNKISKSFEGSCFLENVRERSKTDRDIIQLQETLLSKILQDRDLEFHNEFEGINLIKERLRSKKVLLILDDVGDSKEVENLLGECNWFASGSRVIVTTRDKHVLATLGGDHRICMVKKLSQCEALELFNQHAFQTSKYGEDYSELAKQIISYANGLPLAIEIIGSDLCGKNIHEWKSALEKYKSIPHKNIQEILKISYDGLEKFEKDIFLDIACFYKGFNKNEVVNILASCNLYPDYGIGKLIDKCLVTLEHGHLSMHDLLQQMGREIVRQESKELEKRSRIWCYEDALELLTGNMESDKIQGIMLCSPKRVELPLKAKVFKRMKNLKFLKGNVLIGEELEYLPKELRYLEWSEFPLNLSSKCCLPPELVCLKVSHNTFERAFNQEFLFKNLEVINLSWCQSITKLPGLCCPNLEKLDLLDCKNLIEVHESIGFLEKLKVWNLSGCSKLQILPSSLMLKSLQYFNLHGCSGLEKFPDIHPEMKCLKELNLSFSGIRELPSSLLYLTGLQYLNIRDCKKLQKISGLPQPVRIVNAESIII